MNHLLLNKNDKYLLACSFGPDSMALFYLLLQEGYNFEVAVVNYHLRPESNLEVEELKKYCEQSHINLYILDINRPITHNLESECRKIRYNFFYELCKLHDFNATLVAHHQDDLIETYLMQKRRQNLPEFYGIKEKTTIFGVEIIRPLLSYTKEDLINICKDNNVPFMIDSSNLDVKYLRNKIRHEIIVNLDVEKRTKILTEIKAKNKEINSIFETIKKSDIYDINVLKYFDEITYLYAINYMAKSINPSASISKRVAIELLKVINSKKPNIRLKMPYKLYFVKEYNRVRFEKENIKVSYSYIIDKPMELDTPYFYLDFRFDTKNRNVKIDDYPLTIRKANKDDIYQINCYQVNVRRLFIDWKMPLSIRKKWPVILNKEQKIIYIPRYQTNFKPDNKTNFYVKI